jgi:hypothetical protein
VAGFLSHPAKNNAAARSADQNFASCFHGFFILQFHLNRHRSRPNLYNQPSAVTPTLEAGHKLRTSTHPIGCTITHSSASQGRCDEGHDGSPQFACGLHWLAGYNDKIVPCEWHSLGYKDPGIFDKAAGFVIINWKIEFGNSRYF